MNEDQEKQISEITGYFSLSRTDSTYIVSTYTELGLNNQKKIRKILDKDMPVEFQVVEKLEILEP